MGKADSQYVIVVGCGRMGAHLAGHLSRSGHSVVVIDWDEQKFALLPVEFGGFRLEGDATEVAVLKQAKADRADRLIAVTASDNVNLAVAQMGKKIFNVPVVFARVSDPQRESIFRELDVHTVCPPSLAAQDLLARVLGGTSDEGAK